MARSRTPSTITFPGSTVTLVISGLPAKSMTAATGGLGSGTVTGSETTICEVPTPMVSSSFISSVLTSRVSRLNRYPPLLAKMDAYIAKTSICQGGLQCDRATSQGRLIQCPCRLHGIAGVDDGGADEPVVCNPCTKRRAYRSPRDQGVLGGRR